MPITEAMSMGIPAIVTGWSGTADFVNDRVGYLINYTLSKVCGRVMDMCTEKWIACLLKRFPSHAPATYQPLSNRFPTTYPLFPHSSGP